MHCHARWCYGPFTRLRVPHLQGSEDSQHGHARVTCDPDGGSLSLRLCASVIREATEGPAQSCLLKIMSPQKDIEAPYILASLPQPLDNTNGRTQAAVVHSLSSSKKRKRTELAASVDGEGIFIYAVRHERFIRKWRILNFL